MPGKAISIQPTPIGWLIAGGLLGFGSALAILPRVAEKQNTVQVEKQFDQDADGTLSDREFIDAQKHLANVQKALIELHSSSSEIKGENK